MPSVPLALVLCALLALAAPRCGRAQVTPVGTLAELRAALESNAAPHIQLTQHLDLEAEATLSDGPNAPLLAFGPNTRSLRVRAALTLRTAVPTGQHRPRACSSPVCQWHEQCVTGRPRS